MTLGMRGLVDTRERNEGKSGCIFSQTVCGSFADSAVDGEPTSHITAKVRRCRARDKLRALSNAIAAAKPARNYAQSTKARLRELEHCRRCRIDVAIHEAHVDANVAACISGDTPDTTFAIEPAQSRQPDAARISSHQERRVRRTGDGWECRGDGG